MDSQELNRHIDREIQALGTSAMPHADWIAKILKSASFLMP